MNEKTNRYSDLAYILPAEADVVATRGSDELAHILPAYTDLAYSYPMDANGADDYLLAMVA